MSLYTTALLTLGVLLSVPAEQPDLERFQEAQVHMGTAFKIVLYAPDEAAANRGLEAAFARIADLDATLSDYQSNSELSRLSQQAPTEEPVEVGDDLWRVLERAQQISRRSEGAFDITVGNLTKLWRRARHRREMPSDERLDEALASVGYQNIELLPERQAVILHAPAMRLDLGGIAKGFAADQALTELRRLGIERALVNAGGDLAIGEPPPGEQGWRVGLAPLEPDAEPSRYYRLARCGLATSGDAFQFVEIDGRRYSHILDPRTGLGLGQRSGVSIIAPDCMTADAMASAVSVLGPRKGMELIDQTCGVAGLVVELVDGQPQMHASANLPERSQQSTVDSEQ